MALPALDPSLQQRPTGQSSFNQSFTAFDDRLVAGTRGVVVVRTSSACGLSALLGHASRRLASVGINTIGADTTDSAPLWRQVAEQLGLSDLPSDPARFAGVVAQAAAGRDVGVVARLPRAGSWDRAVAAEVAREPLFMIVLVSDEVDIGSELSRSAFELGPTLSISDKQRWWDAIGSAAATHIQSEDFGRLDDWWASARLIRPGVKTSLPSLSPLAAGLLGSLAIAGRAWPRADIALIDANREELSELLDCGAVVVSRGWASIDSRWRERSEVEAEGRPSLCRVAVADALQKRFPSDPSAHLQAAEIYVRCGRVEEGERAYQRAIESPLDTLSYDEVTARWEAAVATIPADVRLLVATRAAESAMVRGHGPEALRWAEQVFALVPRAFASMMLLGRSLAGVGDSTAARPLFEKAREAASSEAERAAVSAEVAELLLLSGDLVAAVREAESALKGAGEGTAAWIDARNTLGKVMLAESRWDDADAQFAADALLASASRLGERALRARINRGVALIHKSRLDEARALLEAVLADAQRIGHHRAIAIATENLASLAWRQQDYARAIALYEATVQQLRYSNRARAAFSSSNLAHVRCRIGLYDQAEETLAFARRLAGPGPQPARAYHHNYVEAMIAFDRGNFSDAARLSGRAIDDARTAGFVESIAEAQLLSARIALAMGDVVGAESLAASLNLTGVGAPTSSALHCLLAMIACTKGEMRLDLPQLALDSATATGDRCLMIDAHCVMAQHAFALGKKDLANGCLEQAAAIRDQVVRSLPVEIRPAYLARRNILLIDQLLSIPLQALPSAPATKGGPSSSRLRVAPRELVGDDPAIRALRAAIQRVAPSDTTVLIRGESGTGKELVAEAIHRASHRVDALLVSVNCSALVDTLLLSELFGHEKGAFTGASARRRGRFEVAEGGTLFLDEIGDISARAQVSLLRVLQEKSFERVGGTTTLRANVRVVCATHRDLRAMVERGDFREDLYYRLRGVTLELPPLRARVGDIPRISRRLLETIAAERCEEPKALSDDASHLLCRYRWPGNIRELDNALRAASLFADGDVITTKHLVENVADLRSAVDGGSGQRQPSDSSPPHWSHERPSGEFSLVSSGSSSELGDGSNESVDSVYTHVREGRVSLGDLKRQIERDCIARALAECDGNITKAAAVLGMKRPRLSQLVKHYGMSVSSSEDLA